jgi:hypothetical protein
VAAQAVDAGRLDEPDFEPTGPWLTRRRILTLAIAIVTTLAVAEFVVRAAGDRLPPGGEWPTQEYAIKAEQLERLEGRGGAGIVAFGSSVIDVSFDPTLLSRAASPRGGYNAGILGTSPTVIASWAKLVVLPATNPDVVLIAMSSRDLNANGVGSRGLDEEFARSPEVRRLVAGEGVADRIQRQLEDESELLGRRQSLRRPFQSYGLWHPDVFGLDINERGMDMEMRTKQYRGDPKLRAFFRANLLRQFRLSAEEIASLEGFVRELRGRGIRTVLVDVPITPLYIQLHPRGQADFDDYRAALDGVAKRAGAELMSFGTWPDNLFVDPLHLNGVGARRLTTAIERNLATPRAQAG